MLTDEQPLSGSPLPNGRTTTGRLPFVVGGVVVTLLAIIVAIIWGATRADSGVVGGATAHTTPHATPGATVTTTPRVVYQSDWSHGADGWTLPATARIVAGHLLVDGSEAVQVVIPYVPTTRSYMIQMDFQILSVEVGGHFGLTAFNAAGDRQYLGQMQCTPMHQGAWTPSMGGCAGAILVATRGGSYPSGLWTSDYVIHGGPQAFSLEVTGDTVNLCPVDDCLIPVTSATPMDASPRLIIEDRAVKLMVTRVTVTTLS